MSPDPIGRLRVRVGLARPQRASDDLGGFELTWLPVADVWAEVKAGATSEEAAHDGLTAKTPHTLEIRTRSDIARGWRVRLNGRDLRVKHVSPVREAGRLLLACEEETP